MDESQEIILSIDTEEKYCVWKLAIARAKDEGLDLEDLIWELIKERLDAPLKKAIAESPPPITKTEIHEIKRSIANLRIALMAEIRKDRQQIVELAAAIADMNK